MDTALISRLIEHKHFKTFQAHLRLARDCLTSTPLVSYWILYYVLEKSLKGQSQDLMARRLLGSLMTCLEKEKVNRKGDRMFDNEELSKKFIEDYANRLLVRAEHEAQQKVDPATIIKLYLASCNVSQLLTLFGENTEQNIKRIKYCKWKAVTLAKETKQVSTQDSAIEPQNQTSSGPKEKENANEALNEPDFFAKQSLQKFQPHHIPKENAETFNRITAEKFKQSASTLPESDMKKAELLCESALYAIRSNDALTAVNCLKSSLQTLQKNARG